MAVGAPEVGAKAVLRYSRAVAGVAGVGKALLPSPMMVAGVADRRFVAVGKNVRPLLLRRHPTKPWRLAGYC